MSTNQTDWPIRSLALPVIGNLTEVAWQRHRLGDSDTGLASRNGRVEATGTDIASGTPIRLTGIRATEGDFVTNGEEVIVIDTAVQVTRRRRAGAPLALREVNPQSAPRQRSGSTALARKGFVSAPAPDHRPARMLHQDKQVRARENA